MSARVSLAALMRALDDEAVAAMPRDPMRATRLKLTAQMLRALADARETLTGDARAIDADALETLLYRALPAAASTATFLFFLQAWQGRAFNIADVEAVLHDRLIEGLDLARTLWSDKHA